MSSPLSVYKLIILYLLDRADGITKAQISEFLLENGYVNLLSLVQTYAEIEEQGLVRSENRDENADERTFLYITDAGRETLNFFIRDLNEDIRKQADEFLKSSGREIRNEEDLSYRYFRRTDGSYQVELSVCERSAPVIGLTLQVPDRQSAETAVRRWREKNEEIYRDLIEKLF